MDGTFALDGVELADHLGQAPGAQGGEDHDPKEAQGIRAEEGVEDSGHIAVRDGRILRRGQAAQGGDEAAVGAQHRTDDRDDADQHDDALDKVVDRGGHIAADDYVDGGEHCHGDDADGIVDVERHSEQAAQAVIQRCSIGNHKDEDDNGSHNLQGRCGEALLEEVRHGGTGKVLRHDAGAAAEDDPGQQ